MIFELDEDYIQFLQERLTKVGNSIQEVLLAIDMEGTVSKIEQIRRIGKHSSHKRGRIVKNILQTEEYSHLVLRQANSLVYHEQKKYGVHGKEPKEGIRKNKEKHQKAKNSEIQRDQRSRHP